MNEFEKLVYEMRSAQVNYFRTRNKEVLQQSKQLEKRVDEYLIDKKINQQTLF
jgi:hypothetical protein